MAELPSTYNPKDVEERRYQWWESSGLFQADVDDARTPYTIVIPPPNVTGVLHMGHALNNTIQDILIRWKRMQEKNALWVPGTDHAGIATQNVVEREVAKEVITYTDVKGEVRTRPKGREDLGREEFLKRVWQWKEARGNTILYQLRRLGASCDWRRTRFTMDEGLSDAVAEVFVRLYEQGLIYRGNYIINWCPRCQTALADEEAPRQETQGKLYHIRYPLEGVTRDTRHVPRGRGNPATRERGNACVEVATTRPETMLGDTAIAVHPKDKRYKNLIGTYATLPFVGRKLPIVADELVEKGFGTGAVKVTPAHDPVDFQLAKKHGLEFINVMTGDGRMTNVPQPYEGLDRFDCRSKLIVDLEQQGYLGRIEEHVHHVGHCYRCHTVVEPRLSRQWFVKMKPLAEPAIAAVTSGEITFVPVRWKKVYLNWMRHIEDWCISRQIWWGHRIPVWYCDACLEKAGSSDRGESVIGAATAQTASAGQPGVIVSRVPPTRCPSCGSAMGLHQDNDVLDTWFSSWLWPFSTLGWPKETPELTHFYPTDTLVTAPEIIFFWVARMIMAGYFCMGKKPFSTVYIHGTVRDLTGRKMSKSLGNIIDPLGIIEEYGTDALRYTLVTATAIGSDLSLSEERFIAGRNFANKLWNATRYVVSQLSGAGVSETGTAGKVPRPATVAERWILSRLQQTTQRVTRSLQRFLFNDAAGAIHDFLWHDYCDWYLEASKVTLRQGGAGAAHATRRVLLHVLETSLRLLHPVMPYVTEELWQHVRGVASTQRRATGSGAARPSLSSTGHSIMKAPWPKASTRLVDVEAEELFERFMAVVMAIRNTRTELHMPIESRPSIRLTTRREQDGRLFEAHRTLLQALAQVGDIEVNPGGGRPKAAAAAVVDGVEVVMPLAGVIDIDQERRRLQQRVDHLSTELGRVETRLGDPQFTQKAPPAVVEQSRQRAEEIRETLAKLTEHLKMLQAI